MCALMDHPFACRLSSFKSTQGFTCLEYKKSIYTIETLVRTVASKQLSRQESDARSKSNAQ